MRNLVALLVILWFTGAALAQPETVDRIVAVVGDEIILLSEIDEEVYLAQMQQRVDLADEAAVEAYRRQVLDAMVEGKVLLSRARAEGLRVTREEIDQAVAAMVDDVRARFPDENTFLEQLDQEGTTLGELERSFRGRVEEQLLVRQVMDRSVRSQVKVDDAEVRAYWDENRADIPRVPARVELSRILIPLGGGGAPDSVAGERANIVLRRLRSGEDFATLASVFSEGPAAAKGGELGWFRPDDLEPVLKSAVEGLQPGEISDVVISARGAHILKVAEMRGDEFRLSQIVFLRDVTADRASAQARAASVLARIRAGEGFDELARTESVDPRAGEGGYLGKVPLEGMSDAFRQAFESLEPGGISEMLESEEGFSIFRLEGKEGERDPTFEDVSERLTVLLQQEKAEEYYAVYLAEAREETYVEIRLGAEN